MAPDEIINSINFSNNNIKSNDSTESDSDNITNNYTDKNENKSNRKQELIDSDSDIIR